MQQKNFRSWKDWKSREQLTGIGFPGVYAIAHSKKNISGKPFTWREEIIYVGMTIATSGLRGRLKQFDNTIQGKSGHGGADRVRYKYRNYARLQPKLYVAVCSFECNPKAPSPKDLIMMGRVAQFEYECLAQFLGKFDRLPEFNNRKDSPKFSRMMPEA